MGRRGMICSFPLASLYALNYNTFPILAKSPQAAHELLHRLNELSTSRRISEVANLWNLQTRTASIATFSNNGVAPPVYS